MASKEERGNFGKSRTGRTIKRKITITKKPVGKRKITYKFKTKSGKSSSKKFKSKAEAVQALAKANVEEAKQQTRRVKPRRVVQNGAIFEVGRNGFRRVGFTKEESVRRARIKAGTATAKDIIPRLQASQTQAQRGRQILRRLSNAQIAKEKQRRIASQFAIMKKSGRAKTLTSKEITKAKSDLSKLKKQTTRSVLSGLSVERINMLQKRADAINKRGDKLNEKEIATLLFLKGNIQKARLASLKANSNAPIFKNISKLTTKAAFYVADKVAEAGVGITSSPARMAQVVDKALFLEQTRGNLAKKGNTKIFWKALFKESVQNEPLVKQAIRSAFLDPNTYAFALISPVLKGSQPTGVLPRAPKSGSKIAIALRGQTILNKVGSLFKIDKKGQVQMISTRRAVSPKKSKPISKAERRKGVTRATQRAQAKQAKQAASPFDVKGGTKFVKNEFFKGGKRVIEIKEVPVLEVTQKIRSIKVSKSGKVKEKFLSKSDAKALKTQLNKQARTKFKQGTKQKDLQAIVFKEMSDGNLVRLQLTRVRGKQVITRKVMSKNQAKKDPSFNQQRLSKSQVKAQTKSQQVPESAQQLVLLKRQIRNAVQKGDKRTVRHLKNVQRIKRQYAARVRKVKEGSLSKVKFDIKTEVKSFMQDIVKQQIKVTGKPKKSTVIQKTKVLSQKQIAKRAAADARKQVTLEITKTETKTIARTTFKQKTLSKNKILALKKIATRVGFTSMFLYANTQALTNAQALTQNQKSDVVFEQTQTSIAEEIKIFKVNKPVGKVGKATTRLRKPIKQASQKKISKPKLKIIKRTSRSKRSQIKPKIKPFPKKKDPILKSVPNPKGYDVYVRVSGKLKKLNKQTYTKLGANAFGRYVTNNSIARSFIVVGVGRKGKKLPKFVAKTSGKLFRSPKKKSRLSPKTLIEKRRYAINTRGEKKGLKAAAFLKRVSKPSKRKKTAKKTSKRRTKAKKK